MTLRIFCTIYKDNMGLYLPSGVLRQISCNHEYLGLWGVNMAGEEVPLPTTTIPPDTVPPGNQAQSQTALVQVGRIWVDTSAFGDSNFKVCVKIKDMLNLNTIFVDATSYNTQIPNCNLVPWPQTCDSVTGLAAGSITSSGATLSWTPNPGAAGVEYVNDTSSGDPAGDGTYLDGGTTSLAITSLTTSTTYYFHIRTICGKGSKSAWTKVSYVTL